MLRLGYVGSVACSFYISPARSYLRESNPSHSSIPKRRSPTRAKVALVPYSHARLSSIGRRKLQRDWPYHSPLDSLQRVLSEVEPRRVELLTFSLPANCAPIAPRPHGGR